MDYISICRPGTFVLTAETAKFMLYHSNVLAQGQLNTDSSMTPSVVESPKSADDEIGGDIGV